eukprot:3869992-Amphidinium_carterae.1
MVSSCPLYLVCSLWVGALCSALQATCSLVTSARHQSDTYHVHHILNISVANHIGRGFLKAPNPPESRVQDVEYWDLMRREPAMGIASQLISAMKLIKSCSRWLGERPTQS